MQASLAEMGHSQPPTPVATENIASNIIINRTAQQKISRAIDMIFYWAQHRILKNNFRILCEEGKKKLACYVTKLHPMWHNRTIRPRYLKPTTESIKNSKDQRNETERGCDGTENSGVTWKPDNPLTVIWNPIPRKPDNLINGIRDLLPNIIQSQWPRGLTVRT